MTLFLIACGVILFFAGVGFAVAWVAFTPRPADERQLELSLARIENEARAARTMVAGAR